VSRYWKTLRKRQYTEGTRQHSVENSLWKRLWTCRKAGYRMNADSVGRSNRQITSIHHEAYETGYKFC